MNYKDHELAQVNTAIINYEQGKASFEYTLIQLLYRLTKNYIIANAPESLTENSK